MTVKIPPQELQLYKARTALYYSQIIRKCWKQFPSCLSLYPTVLSHMCHLCSYNPLQPTMTSTPEGLKPVTMVSFQFTLINLLIICSNNCLLGLWRQRRVVFVISYFFYHYTMQHFCVWNKSREITQLLSLHTSYQWTTITEEIRIILHLTFNPFFWLSHVYLLYPSNTGQ